MVLPFFCLFIHLNNQMATKAIALGNGGLPLTKLDPWQKLLPPQGRNGGPGRTRYTIIKSRADFCGVCGDTCLQKHIVLWKLGFMKMDVGGRKFHIRKTR